MDIVCTRACLWVGYICEEEMRPFYHENALSLNVMPNYGGRYVHATVRSYRELGIIVNMKLVAVYTNVQL